MMNLSRIFKLNNIMFISCVNIFDDLNVLYKMG